MHGFSRTDAEQDLQHFHIVRPLSAIAGYRLFPPCSIVGKWKAAVFAIAWMCLGPLCLHQSWELPYTALTQVGTPAEIRGWDQGRGYDCGAVAGPPAVVDGELRQVSEPVPNQSGS